MSGLFVFRQGDKTPSRPESVIPADGCCLQPFLLEPVAQVDRKYPGINLDRAEFAGNRSLERINRDRKGGFDADPADVEVDQPLVAQPGSN